MKCPFNDPDFNIKYWEPCPVCGVKGGDAKEIDAKCVEGLFDARYLEGLTDEDENG